jgi:succinate dehydrogenase / fumarate reductase, cytochrome b subunit
MSEAAAASVAAPADRSFLFRRLHSLSGIVPIGAFLLFHLFENLKVGLSPQAYEESIRHLWEMLPRPFFYLVEIGLLGVPILFHALYGFWIWYTGESNTGAYAYRRNWLYTAQRLSGLIAFAYIALHVFQLRIYPDGQLALLRADADLTTFAQVARAVTPAGWTAVYLVGGFAAAFHLGNGLFGFAYSWGLAVSRRAQRNVEAAGWALTAALCTAIVYTVVRIHFPAVP